MGRETPVLRELLRQRSFPLLPRVDGKQTRVVPGCGFGHDINIILLAREGYDAVGADFAPGPLWWLADQLQQQGLQAELIYEDIFQLPAVWARPAGAVWEYTCYCAIDPQRRGEYFAAMAGLLHPGGRLVWLFFPLDSIVGGDGLALRCEYDRSGGIDAAAGLSPCGGGISQGFASSKGWWGSVAHVPKDYRERAMKAVLELVDTGMRLEGRNERGQRTYFDADPSVGGSDTAPRPMELFLQAMMACTAMDVLSIIRKKRRTVTTFRISAEAERAPEHPKVFRRIHLRYELVSPDATEQDLQRAVELSQSTYCSASIMVRRSGCEITWEVLLRRPEEVEVMPQSAE